jgi:hypothetical protein
MQLAFVITPKGPFSTTSYPAVPTHPAREVATTKTIHLLNVPFPFATEGPVLCVRGAARHFVLLILARPEHSRRVFFLQSVAAAHHPTWHIELVSSVGGFSE